MHKEISNTHRTTMTNYVPKNVRASKQQVAQKFRHTRHLIKLYWMVKLGKRSYLPEYREISTPAESDAKAETAYMTSLNEDSSYKTRKKLDMVQLNPNIIEIPSGTLSESRASTKESRKNIPTPQETNNGIKNMIRGAEERENDEKLQGQRRTESRKAIYAEMLGKSKARWKMGSIFQTMFRRNLTRLNFQIHQKILWLAPFLKNQSLWA